MRIFGAALIALTSCLPAQAQMPPDLVEKVAALGRVIDPPKTNALYAPLHDGEPYPGATVVRDIKYGPDDLHALDVFKATQPAAGARPVLIHVHGGGFVRGDKHTAGTPFTATFALGCAQRHVAQHQLPACPEVTWPAGTEDMARSRGPANIAAHGAIRKSLPARLVGRCPSRRVILGVPQFHAPDEPGRRRDPVVRRPYDTTVFDMKPIEPFRHRRLKYPGQSPDGPAKSKIPLLVAFAGLDPPGTSSSRSIWSKRCARRALPARCSSDAQPCRSVPIGTRTWS